MNAQTPVGVIPGSKTVRRTIEIAVLRGTLEKLYLRLYETRKPAQGPSYIQQTLGILQGACSAIASYIAIRRNPASTEEGSFKMCSFWLAEALTGGGLAFADKLDQARLLFERVLGYANHPGL